MIQETYNVALFALSTSATLIVVALVAALASHAVVTRLRLFVQEGTVRLGEQGGGEQVVATQRHFDDWSNEEREREVARRQAVRRRLARRVGATGFSAPLAAELARALVFPLVLVAVPYTVAALSTTLWRSVASFLVNLVTMCVWMLVAPLFLLFRLSGVLDFAVCDVAAAASFWLPLQLGLVPRTLVDLTLRSADERARRRRRRRRPTLRDIRSPSGSPIRHESST